jgi:hypothetical protein
MATVPYTSTNQAGTTIFFRRHSTSGEGDADIDPVTGVIGLVNASGTEINPATEPSKNTGTVDANTIRVTQATDGPLMTRLGSNGDAASPSGSESAQLRSLNDRIGATDATAATSNTGTFSLLAFFKRVIAHLFAARTYLGTTISSSNDNTVIAAPSAGVRIVITKLRIQGSSGVATSCLIKDGASTTLERIRTTNDGTGLSEVYGFSEAIRLSAATAFVINLSAANTHEVSVAYYLETVSTGLPA